jgi:hypothetical protein
VGVDNVWEQEKPEPRKMLVNAAQAMLFIYLFSEFR